VSSRNRRPRDDAAEAGQIGWSVLAGGMVAAILVGVVAAVTFVRTIDLGPRVGDILVFRPGQHLQTDWEVAAQPAGTSSASVQCVLRPDVMTVDGGSLVVEQRTIAPLQYRVHWAGPRTAIGGSNCGTAADLVVSRLDLQLLISAVGGVGVEHRTFAGF
jgi:hypothetical protein